MLVKVARGYLGGGSGEQGGSNGVGFPVNSTLAKVFGITL